MALSLLRAAMAIDPAPPVRRVRMPRIEQADRVYVR
jgi:hypothetical protein